MSTIASDKMAGDVEMYEESKDTQMGAPIIDKEAERR